MTEARGRLDLPRQKGVVYLTFRGDPQDVDHYAQKIKRAIEVNLDRAHLYTDPTSNQLVLTIYPGAVND
jgi:hypothetical protein